MKLRYKIITLFLITFSFIACEDVVNIDLNTAPPKLVVEASILWEKGTPGNNQVIKLTTTTDFYATTIPVAIGAIVSVTDGNATQYDFIETPGTGNYICTNFNPQIGQTYELIVVYAGQTYTATEQLFAVPTIDSVEQNNNGGFTGDEIEIKFFFQDNGATDNFYLEQYNATFTSLPEFSVSRDAFFQGNQMFGLYTNENMAANGTLTFTLQGISERYYNFMNILLGVTGTNVGGGPFQTPPATVRGNIINQTNFDNFALGYFRLSETDKETYVIQ
jgi:hypothetical protein